MTHLTSSLLVSTVMAIAFSGSNVAANGSLLAAGAEFRTTPAVNELVVLERRFDATRGACTGDVGVPTNRVLPDGTRELFVVPSGMAFVLTDIEGEITEMLGAAWSAGTIGTLTAVLTGAVANQYVRARVAIDSEAVTSGIATAKLHLQSGAVADSGAYVCLRAVVLEKNGFRSASVGTDVRLYGFLIAR